MEKTDSPKRGADRALREVRELRELDTQLSVEEHPSRRTRCVQRSDMAGVLGPPAAATLMTSWGVGR